MESLGPHGKDPTKKNQGESFPWHEPIGSGTQVTAMSGSKKKSGKEAGRDVKEREKHLQEFSTGFSLFGVGEKGGGGEWVRCLLKTG